MARDFPLYFAALVLVQYYNSIDILENGCFVLGKSTSIRDKCKIRKTNKNKTHTHTHRQELTQMQQNQLTKQVTSNQKKHIQNRKTVRQIIFSFSYIFALLSFAVDKQFLHWLVLFLCFTRDLPALYPQSHGLPKLISSILVSLPSALSAAIEPMLFFIILFCNVLHFSCCAVVYICVDGGL